MPFYCFPGPSPGATLPGAPRPREPKPWLYNWPVYRDITRYMHRETFKQSAGQLLAEEAFCPASEHDAFASHLYRSRQEYRLVCQRAAREESPSSDVISTFKIAESMGFLGDC